MGSSHKDGESLALRHDGWQQEMTKFVSPREQVERALPGSNEGPRKGKKGQTL
jgi:hypothetical protein